MNTGIRRFILRLAVGLLAFLLGVAAVWALGSFNPFQNSSGTRYYKHKRCGSYSRSSTTPSDTSIIYPVYRERKHGSNATGQSGELPPPPPPLVDSPMPPNPPSVLR